jgi:hypothetical protein
MGIIASTIAKVLAVVVIVSIVVSVALSAIPGIEVSLIDVLRSILEGAT